MQYTEPWGTRRNFGDKSIEPSYGEKIAALQDDYVNNKGSWWISSYWGAATPSIIAETTINTAPYDKNQSLVMSGLWDTWGDGWVYMYLTNADPDIPSPNRYEISHAKYLQSTVGGIYIPNWRFYPNSSVGNIAHSGSHSGEIAIHGTTDVNAIGIMTSNIPVSASTQYHFSVWGKTLDFGGTYSPCVRVKEYAANWTVVSQENLCFGFGTTDWTQQTTSFTTTADTAYIVVVANCWNGYGTFWFDDVELYKHGSDNNLIENGGFESIHNMSDYQCDGYRIDSLSSDCYWPTIENYRREHWKYTDYPLVFSYDTKQPVLLGALSQYDYLAPLHENMIAIDKRVDANIFFYAYSFYGNLIDVFGSEIWELQLDDADASLRRTMCHHKTIRNLLLWDDITQEELKTHINDQMFYGMFPSPDEHWTNATLCERDRDLLKKCIPIIKNISAAGWEPVPYATCDNPDIRFERYGNLSEGLHYTVASRSSMAESGVLSVDLSKLSFDGTAVEVKELVTNITSIPDVENGKVFITIPELRPDDTLVYRISP